ncbi:hypothetical protein SDC9_166171 [bioreactor metagenome]|uniref:Uncharacterized protein n=1 Tax=bioreactor metagenome TaxID=1076179 RepID=A0A645FY40_9ZZZZ
MRRIPKAPFLTLGAFDMAALCYLDFSTGSQWLSMAYPCASDLAGGNQVLLTVQTLRHSRAVAFEFFKKISAEYCIPG